MTCFDQQNAVGDADPAEVGFKKLQAFPFILLEPCPLLEQET